VLKQKRAEEEEIRIFCKSFVELSDIARAKGLSSHHVVTVKVVLKLLINRKLICDEVRGRDERDQTLIHSIFVASNLLIVGS
jgi:hypothetical protein